MFRAQTAAWTAGRLTLPGHDQALAVVGIKVFGERFDPALIHTRGNAFRSSGRAETCSERSEERRDLPALETEPMIRHGSRQREDAFNGVEPVHRAARSSCLPSGREPSRVPDHLGVGEERVGVQAENHRRLVEPEHEIDIAAGGLPQTGEPVLVADGVVGRPLHLGIARAELRDQPGQRRRGERLGEHGQARAAVRGMRHGQLLPGRHEIVPGLLFVLEPDRLRAIGIVEAENRCLDARARRAQR